MTVHAIEVRTGTAAAQGAVQTALDNWRTAHTERLAEDRRDVTQTNSAADGTGTDFYNALVRFDQTANARDPLLDDLQNRLQQLPLNWAVIEYHTCDHDENADGRGGCSVEVERIVGTAPPQDIPRNRPPA